MIGIGCFGDEHEKRVSGIIKKLSPEIYLHLIEAINIASLYIGTLDGRNEISYGRLESIKNFIDKTTKILGQIPLPEEEGEKKVIYFDITYVDKNGEKV